jgi:hypothetical protein
VVYCGPVPRKDAITLKFVFDERKAAAAASRMLQLAGGPIKYIDLLKLLYLVDRQSLIETGDSVTGDEMWSMNQGPVLSAIYDQIKAGTAGKPILGGVIAKTNRYDVELVKPPAKVGPLSKYEINLIDKVFANVGTDHDRIMDIVHQLPEWENPGATSRPIDPIAILRYEGKSEDEIAGLVSEADYYYQLDRRQHA